MYTNSSVLLLIFVFLNTNSDICFPQYIWYLFSQHNFWYLYSSILFLIFIFHNTSICIHKYHIWYLYSSIHLIFNFPLICIPQYYFWYLYSSILLHIFRNFNSLTFLHNRWFLRKVIFPLLSWFPGVFKSCW